MSWSPFQGGETIGQVGSESGVITRDQEHDLGARITLERDGSTAPFSITCRIYGWMLHTRFFGSESEATVEYDRMKDALAEVLGMIPLAEDPEVSAKSRRVSEAISGFVARYP